MGPRVSLSVSFIRVVHSGTQKTFNMPVMLFFWGKENNKTAVTDLMARHGFKLNTGGSGPTGTKKGGGGAQLSELTGFLMEHLLCYPHSQINLHKKKTV